MSSQRGVEQRWGVPFWSLVADFAAQELTRKDTAKALGFDSNYFYVLLAKYPEHDPFTPYNVVAAYVVDSGETFSSAVRRMVRQGMGATAIAQALGFKRSNSLRYAMRSRGLDIEIPRSTTRRMD